MIKVPEFLVQAVMQDDLVVSVFNGKAISLTEYAAREVARRICVALSEHPICPNGEQAKSLYMETGNHADVFFHSAVIAAEWQRRCFLAPEPEVSQTARHIINTFRGVTLTPADADAIVQQLQFVTHGWDISKFKEDK